jgi:hypothetical protein
LTRFRYVDGNAAVWLEELRIGLLAQYLRGVDPDDRLPEKWRDLFTKPVSEWQLPAPQWFYTEAAAWSDLAPAAPAAIETGGARNRRLVEQYDRKSPDYAWELARAFARAAHVLLGHLDAYANEGYLRTATQWDNLRKLAAMVSYQPQPPASATTTVALHMAEGNGAIEVGHGLAMKYAPPEGGAPLIFETLRPVLTHPELNAARAAGWDENLTTLADPAGATWIIPEKAKLAQGDVIVLGGPGARGFARTLISVDRDEESERGTLGFEPTLAIDTPMFETFVFAEPDNVRVGLPESSSGRLVVKVPGAASIPVNTIVELRTDGGAGTFLGIVAGASGDRLVVLSTETPTGAVDIEAYSPFAANAAGQFETPLDVGTLYFKQSGGAPGGVSAQSGFATRDEANRHDGSGAPIARSFSKPSDAIGLGYANISANRVFSGEIVSAPPAGGQGIGTGVRFEGKLPKDLKQDDWYVARPVGTNDLTALKVTGVGIEADVYTVFFNPAPPAQPDRTEFFGPMTRRLRPLGYDRNPDPAIDGGTCELEELSETARNVVKPGKTVLVVHERDGVKKAGSATILTTEVLSGGKLRLTLESDADFKGWEKGWTSFHLNTVVVSHGETKDPKALGSGDAERRRQDFRFKVDTVSFIPSSASVSGVAPDMDVAVDGEKWGYRDFGDPTAEETDAWSVRLNEDDTLQIHFRRRLPTGTNNVFVPRHRTGVGLSGTGVPPWSFTTPMKKNRFVSAVVQPFATSGGADREPITAIRENAPANLAANGRAVSLKDFERLCRRHASVWQARARAVVGPGATNHVDVIVVPAGGGAVTARLSQDLVDFVEARTPPGVAVSISGYREVPVSIVVTARVDVGRYEKSDVQDRLEAALLDEFSLERRGLGQPLYVAEILAAAERVDGVETAVIDTFARRADAPKPLREAMVSGALAAIFPCENQVVHATSGADVVVNTEAV